MNRAPASALLLPIFATLSLHGVGVAQTCDLKNHFRIATNMSGVTNGERRVDTGWQTAGPLVTTDSILSTNTLGCSSQGNCTCTSDFGLLRCQGTGTASNVQGNGCFLWLDEWIGGEPKAHFRDRVTVLSNTLPTGTPVQLRASTAFSGFATEVDTFPQIAYSAQFIVNNQVVTLLANAIGTQTAIVNTTVGAQFDLDGRLFVTLRPQGVQGGTPTTSSYACDLLALMDLVPLGNDVALSFCSGRTYGSLQPRVQTLAGGCGAGSPVLSGTAPVIGGNAAFALASAPTSQAVLLGYDFGAPVPTTIGACSLLLDLNTATVQPVGSTDAAGSWNTLIAVPARADLAGVLFTVQAAVAQPGGPFLGFGTLSNGLAVTTGL